MAQELTNEEIHRLLRSAEEVRLRAYAPYSNFRVGAALLTESGKIFGGCNVENASYGLALCAERSAIASAVAAGERLFRAIAITTEDSEQPCSPCGACRQFMVEFNPNMKVILNCGEHEPKIYDAKDLLPEFFSLPD
jgi:cytidine deaminase